MVLTVGINGFGRLGRIIFRTCLQNPDIKLTAVNDPAIDIDYICYLMKFDSTHGKFRGSVTHKNNEITVDDQQIKVFREKLPSSIPWHTAGVQYVVEASGMFTCNEKASGHLESKGVRRVILTAPSADVPMVILGINDHTFTIENKVLSCASSTLYCLAPIVKILEDSFGVSEGFITSIHAMTPSLKPLDGLCLRGKHWRDHRSIHQNIIPATTGACKALGKIIPQVQDKLIGLAFRVPIVNVSVLDLTIRLNINTSLEEIVKKVDKASKSYLQNIVKLSNEAAVSSDFIGDVHSCVMDVDTSLQLKPNFYKIICWYENEYSYACRVVDTILYSEKQISHPKIPRITNLIHIVNGKIDKIQQTVRETKLSSLPSVVRSRKSDMLLKNKYICDISSMPLPTIKTSVTQNTSDGDVTNRDERRDQIFKVWNTIDIPLAIKQDRAFFFNKCLPLPERPITKLSGLETPDGLETVKTEFRKMFNITGNLIQKYCNNTSTSEKNDIENNRSSKPETQHNEETEPRRNDDESCRHESNVRYTPFDYTTEKYKYYSYNKDTNNSNLKIEVAVRGHEQNDLNELQPKRTKEDITGNINEQISTDKEFTSEKLISYLNINSKSKEKVSTALQDLIKRFNLQAQKRADEIKNLKPTPSTIVLKESLNATDIQNMEKNSQDPLANKTATADSPDNHVLEDFKHLHSIPNGMNVIEEELKKRNIVLECKKDSKSDELFKNCSIEEVDVKENISIEEVDNKLTSDQPLLGSTDISNPDGNVDYIVSDYNDSLSTSSITTISNWGMKRQKQDLYDKLESNCGSDCNSVASFEFNTKKSQILQLTDISSSLEELARLDKICRIIEISDELSDKLFSALDNNEDTTEQRKWSFKDLCEKIQLDDFCDQVFGKTT